ncbi:MAG: alpha/beta hydrolase, partial [Myxococcota bacterium]
FAWCETEPTCDVSATDFVELQDAVDASASDLIASGYSTLILFVRNQYAWDIVAPVVAAALDSLAILEDLALDSDVDESVFLSTVCSDTVPAVDRETAIATQAAFESEYAGPFPVRFFGTIAQEVLEACSVWTAPEPALDFAAALSAVSSETLIITAIGDTQTPSALVDSLLDTLDNEQQVLINEVAHTHAFQELNACVDRAVNDFLLGLPVNATQCPRTVLEIAGALSVPSPKYVSNKLRHRFPRF